MQLKTQTSLEKIQVHHKQIVQKSKSKVNLYQQTDKTNQKSMKSQLGYQMPYKRSTQNQNFLKRSTKSVNIGKLIGGKRQYSTTSTAPINRVNIISQQRTQKHLQKLQISRKQRILKINHSFSLSSKNRTDINSKSLNYKPGSFYFRQQILKNKIQNSEPLNKNINQQSLAEKFIKKVKQAKMLYKYQTKSQRPSLHKILYSNPNRYNQSSLSKISVNDVKIQGKATNDFSRHESNRYIYNKSLNKEIKAEQISLFPTQPFK